MLRGVDDLEKRRRGRAAWAYSLLNQRDFANKAGLTYDRARALLGEKGRAVPKLEELHAMADAAGLPRKLIDEEAEGVEALEARVEDLRTAVGTLAVQLARQGQAIQELRAEGRRARRPANGGRS